VTQFAIRDAPLEGLKRVERIPVGDDRGFLARLFCEAALAAAGWKGPVAQVNHTWTRKQGTIRGMHFQRAPHAEMKLISCLRGVVLDVAVDLRADSPTLLQWHAEEISAKNKRALLIPEGFAHGFQTMSDDCELLYFHSALYAPEAEGGIHPEDPALAIDWPLPVTVLSDRDGAHPLLPRDFRGLTP
jgi:dTDP-4-dehydrorhamnose 3,5-epimerase